MSRARQILALHLPTAIWAAWMAYLLISPDERLPASYPDFPSNAWVSWSNVFEWASHLILSFVLSVLLWRSLAAIESLESRMMATVATVGIYGAILEGTQALVPGRSPGLSDIAANLIGVGLWVVSARTRARMSTPDPQG